MDLNLWSEDYGRYGKLKKFIECQSSLQTSLLRMLNSKFHGVTNLYAFVIPLTMCSLNIYYKQH